ncbi:MAG: type II secretion system F family protein [Acidobacteriota bacterium]
MNLFIAIVFVAVFLSVVLVFFGLQAGAAARKKMTSARLAAISSTAGEPIVDVLQVILRDTELSSVPWLHRVLLRMDVFGNIQTTLTQAHSQWTVSTLLAYSLMGAIVSFLLAYWRTNTLIPSAVIGCGVGFIPYCYILRLRASRLAAFERRLPEALDMMVSAIRAGHGISAAIGTVARETPPPISTEFRICHDEQTFGLDFRTAMQNLAARVPLHDVQIIVTAILIQKECGGNLAEIVEKVAYIIRERFRLKRQISVHTAQGRLTGWILAMLPVALGFGMFLVNPNYMEKLWQNEVGLKLIYAAATMTFLGGLIIRKIINVRM